MWDICKRKQSFLTLHNSFFHKLKSRSNVSNVGNVTVNTIGNPAGPLRGGPAGMPEVTEKVLYHTVSKNMLLAQRPEAKVMAKDNRIKVVKGQGDQVLVEAMEAVLVKIIITEVALVKIIVKGLYLSMNNNWPSPPLVSPISILSLVSFFNLLINDYFFQNY